MSGDARIVPNPVHASGDEAACARLDGEDFPAFDAGSVWLVGAGPGAPGLMTLLGYHALRTGDNVGEHTIVFGMMGETIDLTVRGHSRDSYAYGALAAAKFLVAKKPGLYSIDDALGLWGPRPSVDRH